MIPPAQQTASQPAAQATPEGPTAVATPGLLSNPRFLTGAVLGGAVTYVLTHEAAQRKLMGGLAHLWLSLQGGVAEAKERFRDAQSEVRAEAQSATQSEARPPHQK